MEKELLARIVALEDKVRNLESASSISHDTESAFRERFRLDRLDDAAIIENSAKSATSENQSVNEAGTSTYAVLRPPDAFIETTVDGATKYIPIYT